MEEFEWDSANSEKNWIKHRVSIKECEQVFFNKPLLIGDNPKHSQSEKRFSALGKTSENRLLAVFFTIRGNKVRIISARDQSRKERKQYEKANT